MLIIFISESVNHHRRSYANNNKSNAMFYVAHTVFQRHMMRIVASVANVKIHAAVTSVQMTRNVLSISHSMIHHLHQFAAKVRQKHTVAS